jgi:hypothetical protein
MAPISGPALVAAALLVLAGAQKVLDPASAVGALRALRLPAAPSLVRAGSALEMALGALAVTVGGPLLWAAVAGSYLAFSAFVLAAMRAGTMVGSCGCFGREDTPPDVVHIVANLALAAVAVVAAAALDGPALEGLADEPVRSIVLVGLASVAVYLLHAVYVELPRTRAASRLLRSP